MNLDLSEAIDLYILLFGGFKTEIVKCAKKLELNKFNNIIDIGANFGVQTLQIADEFKNLKKIFNIDGEIDKIKHGSSINILLM